MPRKRTPREEVHLPHLPHSWDFTDWPRSVYPGNTSRARYLFRVHRDALLAEGACARVGKSIVFFGGPYSRFLEKRASRVPDFDFGSACNDQEGAAA